MGQVEQRDVVRGRGQDQTPRGLTGPDKELYPVDLWSPNSFAHGPHQWTICVHGSIDELYTGTMTVYSIYYKCTHK